MILYLAGPIFGRTDADCSNWREWVKSNLSGETLDPMRRDYRGREDECVNEIVEGDKEDISTSSAVIALVNPSKPSIGTTMEIHYAWSIRKPIYIALIGKHSKISPWLKYHSSFIGTLTECVKTIKEKELCHI